MSALTCRQFIEFLDDYLAATQPPEVRADFERHVNACRHCADYLRTYRDTIVMAKAVIGAQPDASVPAEVPRELVGAVHRAIRGAREASAES
jgi:anti-sigma factor RsiW